MNKIKWFQINTADLLTQSVPEYLSSVQDVLDNKILGLFKKHIQTAHAQLHHYCQPRQNETMQGRNQFLQKNKRTLEPAIKALEKLYDGIAYKDNCPVVYLHLADPNLDELLYCRPNLLERLQNLARLGIIKIAGGNLDEAFIGPDSQEISVATICAYFEKIAILFGKNNIAPLVWLPERFFEDKTQVILDNVFRHCAILHNHSFLNIIVDENVIEHSLPKGWKGNIFKGWRNPNYTSLRIFASSNTLRAIMPQASPVKVNEDFFALMDKYQTSEEKDLINWFLGEYERLIFWMNDLAQNPMDEAGRQSSINNLLLKSNDFYDEATKKLANLEPLHVFFVDDLEKNGSWTGSYQFAFEPNRHFYKYLKQAANIFNPYNMKSIDEYNPKMEDINNIKPSSYKEFSVIWNNKPLDVEKWREMTLQFINNGIHSLEEITALDEQKLKDLQLDSADLDWYSDFVRKPISWQEGQFTKYPEIELNYHLAQIVYQEITDNQKLNVDDLFKKLTDDNDFTGNLLHIWNKNRASCPNFIGFFGGASILFFRLHIASQLATVLALKYYNQSLEKQIKIEGQGEWTLVILNNVVRIFNHDGVCVFYVDFYNFHNLASGFSRHREGYNSLMKQFLSGRTDAENFALVEKEGGTTSAHPLVVALDLPKAYGLDIIKKSYPDDLTIFDSDINLMGRYPNALEQIWVLPSKSVSNPIKYYQKGNMGKFTWLETTKYIDKNESGRVITFVKKALFNGQPIEVIRKIEVNSFRVKVEIWNRSQQNLEFNPVIAFPLSLDWYEGKNYTAFGEQLPKKGRIKEYDGDELIIEDKISNLGFRIKKDSDFKFFLTTVYSFQTSDTGAYRVSPQHELVVLSPKNKTVLPAVQSRQIGYELERSALRDKSINNIDWEKIALPLKNKIDNFSSKFLKKKELTEFQREKLIYSRYPEIIFWAD